MIAAKSMVVGALATMLAIDIAEGAELVEPAAMTVPAVVRTFDLRLSGPPEIFRQRLPPPAEWQYRDIAPWYGNREPRRRAYGAFEGYRWRAPRWGNRYGSRPSRLGRFEQGPYRYGYGPRRYYGFYDWQRPRPDYRADWNYGWRSQWAPSPPSIWRRQ